MRRVEILLDDDLTKALDLIALQRDTSRSFLLRKAVRLYLDGRRAAENRHTASDDTAELWWLDES